jgi:hypothetical protein
MSGQQDALQRVLDKADNVSQTTVEETVRLLRDQLPTVLAELKLPPDSMVQQALRTFREEQVYVERLSASAEDVERLKELNS